MWHYDETDRCWIGRHRVLPYEETKVRLAQVAEKLWVAWIPGRQYDDVEDKATGDSGKDALDALSDVCGKSHYDAICLLIEAWEREVIEI